MKKRKALSIMLVMAMAFEMAWGSLAPPKKVEAAVIQSDFLKTDGKYIKKNYGTGEPVTLRGTNLGGWLAQEDWMSPLGEFAADRTGWTASASASPSSAASALDGDSTTRWTPGVSQAGGQWIQVNLGTPTLFNRMMIDAAGYTGEYPRGYQIQVSSDAATWKDVASGVGTEQNIMLRFTPQVAQYVRVTQTGSTSGWWSVAELNLFNEPVLNNSGFTATASHTAGGSSASAALDGDVNTRWTSGAPQSGGQEFVINLGKNTEVSRILFDAGPSSTGDYARGYEIWGLSDGTWVKYASGTGSSRMIYAEFWWTYWMSQIKIVQTGTAANWWSISDVAIYSGGGLERTGWTFTASSSAPGTTPAAVKDGSAGTVWSTGANQGSGQWFQADLGAAVTFNQIVLDTEKNSGYEQDYPRGYTVQVSKNGTAWTTIATGTGQRKATAINFAPVSARYIKITQTGSAGNWWSIGEFQVYLNHDDYSLFTTLNQRFGAAAAENIYTAHQDTWITSADFDNLANLGINVIRLPIAWFEIVNENGTIKANAWDKIDWAISQASQRNIYTIIDLHTVPGGGCPWGSCGKAGPNPNTFWTHAPYQDMVVEIWKAIANRYRGNAAVAGYDLINEPLIDYGEDADDVAQKNAFYDRVYDAVRAIDPDHTIYIAAFFDWANIAPPSTYGWTNVVYEVHPYDMPGGKDWNAQHTLVETQLNNVQAKLNDPNYGIPVLYGEYSLYHYDDVWAKFMSGMNALHVNWTNWSYKVRGDMLQGTGGYWGFYNSNANPVPIINSDSASTITSKLQKFGTSQFQPNTSFIQVVKRFAKGEPWMATIPLDQTGWTASASSTEGGGSASHALDWNTATRWSSGVSQAGGQWFQVNMGAKQAFDQISLETPSTGKWDYPRGYQVQVSNDGTSWTTVKTGSGFGWKQAIVLGPQYAQYVRVVQTGSAAEWWSIAEFHVYGEPALSRAGWTASASSTDPASSLGGALDHNPGTRWSSGAPQAGGQYYQVDMGRQQTFNRVSIDAGASAGDYPRGYEIQVSRDGANWTTAASGTGTEAAILAEFPVQYARYLKVIQTGTAASWWSIHELNVYGELEKSRNGWTMSASSSESGSLAGNAADGNDGTRWSSGANQAAGQWFKADLGSNQWFNHIVMDSGASTNDYPRDYIVEVSTDNANWRTVANGEGTGAVVAVNFSIVEARYIRVTLKKASTSWWSISEFRVFE